MRFFPGPMSREGYRMTLSLTLLLSAFATLLLTTPAVAQEKVFSTREGQGYEVFEDGMIIIGGDVVGDCPSLLEDAREMGTAGSPQTSMEVEVCTEAGFPPRGSDALTDTGGFPVVTVAGAMLLLVTSALGFLGIRLLYVP